MKRLLALLLLAAAAAPAIAQKTVYNPTFSGPAQSILDMGGFGITNCPSITTNAVTAIAPADSHVTVSGSGTVTIGLYHVVLTDSTYADPSFITSLAWSKLTGTPTTLAGYGLSGADGSSLVNLNASNLSSGTIGAARLPAATTSAFGAVKPDGTTITVSGGVISSTALSNPMTAVGDLIIGNTSGTPARLAGNTSTSAAVLTQTGTGSASVAPTWSNAPAISAANMTSFPTLNQNTTGTAAGLSGTPALPNGTTATTQSAGDNSTKVATTAFTQAAISPLGGFKNVLIGGDFSTNPWQRGTSFSLSGTTVAYGADRWGYNGDSGSAGTISQITGIGLTNFGKALRMQRTSGNTSTGSYKIAQVVESVNVLPLQGKTCTLSAWVRAGANYSGGTGAALLIKTGTGTDEGLVGFFSAGWTGNAQQATNFTPTTTWARYSFTFTVPTTATELGAQISWGGSGTAGSADLIDVTGIQLEVSPVATDFERRFPTTEMQLCRRYYRATCPGNPHGAGLGSVGGIGISSGGIMLFDNAWAVPMRTTPTMTEWQNGTQNVVRITASGSTGTITSVSAGGLTANGIVYLGCSTPTAGTLYDFDLVFDAEL